VRDGVDALTHQPGDAGDLARAIDALAGDASLRARFGAAARQAAVERFDARRLGDEFVDLYESVRDRAVAHR
jgi:glycosyltransferase involved in cell wall biosynthesis